MVLLISNSPEVKSYISIYTNSIPCYYLGHLHQMAKHQMAKILLLFKYSPISENKVNCPNLNSPTAAKATKQHKKR